MERLDKLKEIMLMLMQRPFRPTSTFKIFCIGRNKTGTTSLASFFRTNGYRVGNQERAELLVEDWAKRDFTRIIRYCETAEVFQDVPFSLADTYRAMDQAYPGSKFILTLRASPEEWYNSLLSHHSKMFSSGGGIPSEDDLRRVKYRGKYEGWLLFMQKAVYGYPTVPLYDKQAYMAHYEKHNVQVMDYFRFRPDDLLVVNLSDEHAFERLCLFVGMDPSRAKPLPHRNRSSEMKRVSHR